MTDFDETYSLVVKATNIRVVRPIAVSSIREVRSLDVKNVFRHGFLQKEVYMSQSLDFIDHSILSMYVYLKSHRMVLNKHQDPRLIRLTCISHTLASSVVRHIFHYLHGKLTKATYFCCYMWMILLLQVMIHRMSHNWFDNLRKNFP